MNRIAISFVGLLLQTYNPGKGTFARPNASTSGLTGAQQMTFFVIVVAFIVYAVIRVWWSLRKGEKDATESADSVE
jgi:hypothetical protein